MNHKKGNIEDIRKNSNIKNFFNQFVVIKLELVKLLKRKLNIYIKKPSYSMTNFIKH